MKKISPLIITIQLGLMLVIDIGAQVNNCNIEGIVNYVSAAVEAYNPRVRSPNKEESITAFCNATNVYLYNTEQIGRRCFPNLDAQTLNVIIGGQRRYLQAICLNPQTRRDSARFSNCLTRREIRGCSSLLNQLYNRNQISRGRERCCLIENILSCFRSNIESSCDVEAANFHVGLIKFVIQDRVEEENCGDFENRINYCQEFERLSFRSLRYRNSSSKFTATSKLLATCVVLVMFLIGKF